MSPQQALSDRLDELLNETLNNIELTVLADVNLAIQRERDPHTPLSDKFESLLKLSQIQRHKFLEHFLLNATTAMSSYLRDTTGNDKEQLNSQE